MKMLLVVPKDGALPDISLVHTATSLEIDGFDRMSYTEGTSLAYSLASRLSSGCPVEFDLLDFQYAFEYYRVNRKTDAFLSRILYTSDRRSVWDELGVADVMLRAGFGKVWTGRVPELPVERFLVKAITV